MVSSCLICRTKIEPDLENETEVDTVDSEACVQADTFIGGDDPYCTDQKLSQAYNQIEKQLHVVFILRNVLELPKKTLEKYLKLGGNPEGWISVCGKCSKEIDNIKRIFGELQRISRMFQDAKEAVREKIWNSFKLLPEDVGDDCDYQSQILDIQHDCRRIVKQRTPRPSRATYTQVDKVDDQLQLAATIDDSETISAKLEEDEDYDDEAFEVQDDSMEIEYLNEESLSPKSHFKISDEAYQAKLNATSGSSEDQSEDEEYQFKSNSIQDQSGVKRKKRRRPFNYPTKCDHCNEECSNRWTLREHKLANHLDLEEKDKRVCNICKRNFRTKARLINHLEEISNHEKHKCHVCGKQEAFDSTLKKHLFTEHGLPRYDCPFEWCSKYYHQVRSFTKHLSNHPTSRPETPPPEGFKYVCDLCGKELVKKGSLAVHKFIVHKIGEMKHRKYYECTDCGLRSFGKNVETAHRRVCPKRISFECDVCGLKYHSKQELAVHQKHKHSIEVDIDININPTAETQEVVEGIEDRYPCTHCGKLFFNEKSLLHHEKWIHDNARRFTCDVASCEYATFARNAIDLHKARVHQIGTEKFKCDKCQHFCQSMRERKSHVCDAPEKKNRKKHVCTICGHEFSKRNGFQDHVLSVHEKKYKFNCDISETCNYVSNSKSNVESHMAARHGIGDWKCEEEGCSKVFHRQKLLEDHVKYKHKGEARPKIKICPICGVAFSLTTVLNVHIQIMHSENKDYKCEWCGDAFKTPSYRSLHKRKCPQKKQNQK